MNAHLDKLLQECLSGLDAGLTPDECLSAWPEQRPDLEPMLRQAMMLRIAFASAPRPEFRLRACEKLMFAAGREAVQALESEPEELFVRQARQRFLTTAGASAQEALRNVPPPRLAFWVNARRHLIANASARPTAPAGRPMALAFRASLSAAVVVLAMAVAGLAYFTVQTPGAQSVSAQLAAIDEELTAVEEQAAAGNPVAVEKVVDLTRQLNAVAEKISHETPSNLSIKASDLVQRQKEIVNQAAPSSPAIQEAKQQLDQAESRIQAARVDTPVAVASAPSPVATTPALSTVATGVTATVPAVQPSGTAVATATAMPLGPNEARLIPRTGENFAGQAWVELQTERLSILVPASWTIVGPTFDASGLAKFEGRRIRIDGPDGTVLNVTVTTGEVLAIVGGNPLVLRTESGTVISVVELVARTGGLAAVINHMIESISYTPLPTPTPTATPAPSSTPPPATGTATP